jgi:hypothetical protein
VKLRQVLADGKPYGYEHLCPGCKSSHIFVVEGGSGRKDADGKVIKPERTLCHYHLIKGRIRFLNDCEHELKGREIELPDLPEDGAA